MTTTHIAGAGLAGLACALRLAEAGHRVVVYEAAPQAGGRCRSFHDATLDRVIDNGSHLVLSGNRALLGLLERVGARDRLAEVHPAAFPFHDLRTGQHWTLCPGGLWLFDEARRVPGSRVRDYLAALTLLTAGRTATVADALPPGGALYERLWAPLVVSGINMPYEKASARLFAAILRETLLRGEAACRPQIATKGLSHAFIEPILGRLKALGATVHLNVRVEAVDPTGFRAAGVRVDLGADGSLVLALPAWGVEKLLPEVTAPPPGPAIVNAHFRLDRPAPLPGGLPFLALVGGTAEWLFARGDVLSVTVSAADALAALPAEEIAAQLWADAAGALGTAAPLPPYRVVKERRATTDQSPTHAASRPPARTAHPTLFLAGDWTDTGLPATLEGAVRSGERAAEAVLRARITPFARLGRFPAFTLRRSGHI
ncbi:hydroxysqualene dehydroxylase HpnE [Azospirillum sp. TSO22-1]|uniref:hydroxysqualene dehydroxylase HpnE n=1 Tax=Azospirillum sp. TSO22-1 TaxID=716789 RepID=UPI000D60D380|nr:hydroxysqualene dehydroxylase HpnE [Azospirillum sp. TSO22-1]PWC55668.1 phytoene dehydrogenase [Azospirillum sp. TSO22-1]